MSLKRVVEIAQGELGNMEDPPGSNRIKYWDEYDKTWQGQPWCVTFLWWVFRHAGEGTAFMGGGKTASCGILQRWFKAQGQTVSVSEAQPGDIALMNFHGGKVPEHCGLIVNRADRSMFQTIEGNTVLGETGNQSNGGCVAKRWRYASQIVEVCRPTYKEEPMNDWEKHWAAQHIQWAIDEGIVKGYQDGSFQPDKPITRAEMVTMLHRYDAAKSKEERSNE